MRIDDISKTFRFCGTDKWSHGYAMIYDKVPCNIENIIEVGTDAGNSIHAWTRIFPKATIYGIDQRNECQFHHERFRFIPGAIGDFNFTRIDLWKWAEVKFDLVVDDGSHEVRDILSAWHILSPKCCGFYVIEDINWPQVPEIMEEITKYSSHTSVIQTGRSDGDRCIVASFEYLIQW